MYKNDGGRGFAFKIHFKIPVLWPLRCHILHPSMFFRLLSSNLWWKHEQEFRIDLKCFRASRIWRIWTFSRVNEWTWGRRAVLGSVQHIQGDGLAPWLCSSQQRSLNLGSVMGPVSLPETGHVYCLSCETQIGGQTAFVHQLFFIFPPICSLFLKRNANDANLEHLGFLSSGWLRPRGRYQTK